MKQNKHFQHFLVLFLSLILIFSSFIVPSMAYEGKNVFSELKNPNGAFLAVSKYGNTREFPEQSLDAILSAVEQGADMVYVYVKKTSDNCFVLMADDDLSRMCVDSLGNPAEKSVSDIGYHELSTYHLRQSTGSLHEPITKSVVPTLQEVLSKVAGDAVLLLDGVWEYRDEIYDFLRDNNVLSSAVILSNGNTKQTVEWLSSKATMPLVMSSYNGNIVFKATSKVKKTLTGGAIGSLLSTGNAYGMNFKDVVLKKFEGKGRAAIDMTDPKLSGKREDNIEGWNDVTARGYTILITNNIPELLEYFDRVAKQRERLLNSIKEAQSINVTLCSTASSNALKDAIANANEVYDSAASERSLSEANYQLYLAMNALTNRTENEGKTVTKGRVIAVVLVVIALILFEIVFETVRRRKYKKRKKLIREHQTQRNEKS